MKPHPRIRKSIKWGGAAATVLLVGVWIGSWWRWATWVEPRWGVLSIKAGRIEAYSTDITGQRAIEWTQPRMLGRRWSQWSFHWVSDSAGWQLDIPLWLPTVVCATIAVTVARFDLQARRGERMGRCPKCNYDRAGLAAGAVCPECGAPVV